MSDFVELQRLFNIVLRRWWLLVGLMAIAVAAGYAYSRKQTPVYEATVTVLVGEITKSTNLNREDMQMSALFAQTYADLAARQPVLQGVVEKLNLDETWEELRNKVRVSSVDGTQLIEIKAEANSRELAQSIADEVARHLIMLSPTDLGDSESAFVQSFIRQQMEETRLRILSGQEKIKEIEEAMSGSISTTRFLELQNEKENLERLNADLVLNYVELSSLAAQDRNLNSLSIIEEAYSEEDPIRPQVTLNMLLSAGLGMLLAIGIIFLWEFLDDSVKSVDDLEQFAGLTILGTVGRIKGKRYSEKLLTRLESSSPTRESFRMIRNKIRFGSGEEPIKSIVVTSPESEEGKSITVANLGAIMAQANVRTVLIDADLEHPVLHKVFNTSNRVGLVNLLESPEIAVQDCLKPTLIHNLQIMTSGEAIQNQSDQLLAERVAEILDYLLKDEGVDLVIIDGPPALLSADASILSNLAEGVILVARAGKTKRKAIKQTLSDLEEAKARLIGCIYNQVQKDIPIAPYKRTRQEKNLFRQLKGLLSHVADSMK